MSRHKLVKALDLDDELNDFDGGAESDYDEEIGAEDKGMWIHVEQAKAGLVLRLGTIRVRKVLGDDISVTNKEIEDSLWHYYYDTEKTINYLLSLKTDSQAKKTKASKNGKGGIEIPQVNAGLAVHIQNFKIQKDSAPHPTCCSGGFSATDFFRDSPWLNIPNDRLGEILIEPLYPQLGLLGGASNSGGPPKSKLAALAAARKRKENQIAEDGQISTNAVTLLDKLGGQTRESRHQTGPSPFDKISEKEGNSPARKYPNRKKHDVAIPPEKRPLQDSSATFKEPSDLTSQNQLGGAPFATPSIFARTALGTSAGSSRPSKDHELRDFETDTEFNFAGPSPDDVVLNAQNSKGPHQKPVKPKPQSDNSSKSVEDAAQGLKDVNIEEVKIKGKNLNVLAEFENSRPKNAANFVVIGHVDAGKSTLMGRLLHDLNVVDKRTIERYREEAERLGKSSFALAWVLDQGTEERERGVTIDIAMNKFETKSTSFTILDAPGHRDFIPNMIAGASQADFAVLVIDASTGNFESGLKGQTKEHALLVRSMGVQRIVIAVNKLDTVQWSQDRFEEITQQISAFLTSAGFLHKNLAFVPCAGLSGENVTRQADNPKASWYTGPTLITVLESSEPITHALEKPLRLTIDDVFRGGVQNPLSISGRIDAGSIQIGDRIQVMPANHGASIKGLEVDSEPADWAVAGQNVILHLTEIEAKYLRSGDAICPPSALIQCVTSIVVKLLAFEHITPMHCEVHKGRLHAPGRVTKLVAQLDKASGAVEKGKKPRLVKPGSVAKIIVEVDDPIPLEQGSRIIIRAGGETVGAGLVE